MKLPENWGKVVADCNDVPHKRKQEILDLLTHSPERMRGPTIQSFLSNGGAEAKLISKMFGVVIPTEGNPLSQQNKMADFKAK